MEKGTNDFGFYYFGKDIKINGNFYTASPERIYIGDSGIIAESVELSVSENWCNIKNDINLKINDNFFFNSRVKIEAANYVEIGRYVTVGPEAFISDLCHEYKLPQLPVKLQGFINVNENKVIIKDGAWIGAGAKVIGNLTVGYGAVIGTNAVVTKDIPDHSVAVGVPARVIKIFDYSKGTWVNVKDNSKLLRKVLISRGIFKGYDFDLIEKKEKGLSAFTDVPEIINERIDKIVIVLIKINKVIKSIINLLLEEKYDDSKLCLIDLTSNLDTIQKSIKNILEDQDLEFLKESFITLNKNLNLIINMYENKTYNNAIELFQNSLLITIDNLSIQLSKCKK